ncbi:MAG TPA: hypothetical protein VLY63_14210 [Anaerolineae bacterium]|nr:hypothetical protein [Anaerolineae bacterium]
MCSLSPNERRKKITSFLAHQRTGVISAITAQGMSSMPVWYRLASGPSADRGLELDCLVPRWADVAHHLAENAKVLLIVQVLSGAGLCWAQVRGTASPVEAPDWARLLPRWVSTAQPDQLYLVVRVAPTRIDLIDEDLGWGIQETLEW